MDKVKTWARGQMTLSLLVVPHRRGFSGMEVTGVRVQRLTVLGTRPVYVCFFVFSFCPEKQSPLIFGENSVMLVPECLVHINPESQTSHTRQWQKDFSDFSVTVMSPEPEAESAADVAVNGKVTTQAKEKFVHVFKENPTCPEITGRTHSASVFSARLIFTCSETEEEAELSVCDDFFMELPEQMDLDIYLQMHNYKGEKQQQGGTLKLLTEDEKIKLCLLLCRGRFEFHLSPLHSGNHQATALQSADDFKGQKRNIGSEQSFSLRWLFGSSVVAESFKQSQQLVLSGSVRHHVAVLLQQDAVECVLVVRAVAHIRDPQELPVLQAKAVPVEAEAADFCGSPPAPGEAGWAGEDEASGGGCGAGASQARNSPPKSRPDRHYSHSCRSCKMKPSVASVHVLLSGTPLFDKLNNRPMVLRGRQQLAAACCVCEIPAGSLNGNNQLLIQTCDQLDNELNKFRTLTIRWRSSWVGPGTSKLSQVSAERRYSSLVPAMLYSPGMLIFQLPFITNWERPFWRAGNKGEKAEGFFHDMRWNQVPSPASPQRSDEVFTGVVQDHIVCCFGARFILVS
ncbi:hypothetical protein INR49_020105 [Caranx melampygus]|nr:hypothetical protein INR49_020105 [Caranx melampygus]